MSFPATLLPKVFLLLVLTLLASAVIPCGAQIEDAQGSIDKPGLALVKPQAWSKDEQAVALDFFAYANRSGYYVFRTEKSSNHQVATSKIVKLVVYPDPPKFLTTSEQRASLQKSIEELATLAGKFPTAAKQLEDKALAPLKADAVKYDAGSVKDDGQWIPRRIYFRQKALALADLLRPELSAAPNIKEVDLTMNQYYLGIEDLAKSDPSVQAVLDGVRKFYESLVRKADREGILNLLNSTKVGSDEARELVKKLKALKPDEDSRSSLYLRSWDTAAASAEQLTRQITDVQTQFEAAVPTPDESLKLPPLPPELITNVGALSDAIKTYRAGSPPSAIQVPLALADALTACGSKFPDLSRQLQSREYFDAKAVVDPLANQADVIGPKTSKLLAELRKKLAGEISKYETLRNEGKMLADNDKIEEALKKYQQAFAIIPSKDVAAQIDSLKKQ
ncbi:MAG: hypothetical protein IAE94_11525 [Chthoniobacterales bacterium]|nr:hypothetical protein [Chthoniobacterales bacterium]